MLLCKPERIIVAAFYPGTPKRQGVETVGAILRKEVLDTEPSDGDFLLVYVTNAASNFTPNIERALRELDCRVKVYGPDRTGTDGNIEFCEIANVPFVRDMASCRAVFSTAGNQLISEAIHFGKPLLLIPEKALEQRLNARFIENWGAGMQTHPGRVTPALLRRFLGRREEFAANIAHHRRDELATALDAIDRAVSDLATKGA
jgi:uncharacterized protein (TIGR00661 family)